MTDIQGQPPTPEQPDAVYSGSAEGDPRDPLTIGEFMLQNPLIQEAARREVYDAEENLRSLLAQREATNEQIEQAHERLNNARTFVDRFVPPEQ